MARLLAIITAGCLLALGTDARAAGAPPLQIVALGNSVTATGALQSDGWLRQYEQSATAGLTAPVHVNTFAVFGGVAAQIRSRAAGDDAQSALAQATIVTVEAGLNDFLFARGPYVAGTCGGADHEDCLRAMLANFDTEFGALLSGVADATDGRPVALRTMTIYYPVVAADLASGDFDVLRAYLAQMNDAVAARAAAHGFAVADIRAAFNGVDGAADPLASGLVLPDGVHPSSAGHAAIAAAVAALGYAPLDEDGDSVIDARDNCAGLPNTDQRNTDGMIEMPGRGYIDATRPMSDEYGDTCDADDDNDGLSDADEASGAACASRITDPLLDDSDGDRVLDGAECALGGDPTRATSLPPSWLCGTNSDADGDDLLDNRERCYYNTSPSSGDSDGDGCGDVLEVTSINADRIVNIVDLQQILSAANTSSTQGLYVANFDVSRNGSIDVLDLQQVARLVGANC